MIGCEINISTSIAKIFKKVDSWAANEHNVERYQLVEIQTVLKSMCFTIIRAHCTFNLWGRLGYELETIIDDNTLKILSMSLLKIYMYADQLSQKYNKAAVLIIAMKTSHVSKMIRR